MGKIMLSMDDAIKHIAEGYTLYTFMSCSTIESYNMNGDVISANFLQDIMREIGECLNVIECYGTLLKDKGVKEIKKMIKNNSIPSIEDGTKIKLLDRAMDIAFQNNIKDYNIVEITPVNVNDKNSALWFLCGGEIFNVCHGCDAIDGDMEKSIKRDLLNRFYALCRAFMADIDLNAKYEYITTDFI